MRVKPLDRQILAIALPAIATNVTTPLLGLVDTAITGHIGADALGAVALGGTVFSTMYMLFGFLRMGTSGLTAQANGRGDIRAGNIVLGRAMLLSVLFGLAIVALSPWLGVGLINLMDARDATSGLASEYFQYVVFGAPAVLLTYSLTGWFIGMQDTRSPLYVAILTNISNIALSATLVYALGWGVKGVACGTLISQWLGAAVLWLMARKKGAMARESLEWKVLMEDIGSFFRVNRDIFLRTLCLCAVTLFFARSGALQSVEVLGANQILLQLFLLFSYFIDGFAYAAEALCGKFHGSGDGVNLRKTVTQTMLIGAGGAVVFSLVYWFGGHGIVGILTDDGTVASAAIQYLPWAAVVPLCGFGAFVWDGVLIGLTRTAIMLAAIAMAMLVFFGVYFASAHAMGNNGLWLAFDLYLLTRSVASYMIYSTKDKHSSK